MVEGGGGGGGGMQWGEGFGHPTACKMLCVTRSAVIKSSCRHSRSELNWDPENQQ